MKKEEKKMQNLNEEKRYRKNWNDFLLDFFLKVIPGTLIVIMCVYRLFALPPVLNTYVVIHLILIAIIVFFYTDIMLSTIYTFVKLRKQKREFFL
ncbi:hypothetical protein [Listeria booriae]|uniref:Uncharacterized protein n=1 Tax=Listeria booriae TaxID=1552123 RepID=A0A7X1DSJ2_9LIST|nr:hypothetical protein [Listeria booriae]MBC1228738.1 hypothetical protein [Listeria booriae]MBC1567204.1 hypothetical protein [Listeria booriae]MBC2373600.1 hypothetical protein [Listeria booriae]